MRLGPPPSLEQLVGACSCSACLRRRRSLSDGRCLVEGQLARPDRRGPRWPRLAPRRPRQRLDDRVRERAAELGHLAGPRPATSYPAALDRVAHLTEKRDRFLYRRRVRLRVDGDEAGDGADSRFDRVDLTILNLGAAVNPHSVAEQEQNIQGMCAVLTGLVPARPRRAAGPIRVRHRSSSSAPWRSCTRSRSSPTSSE